MKCGCSIYLFLNSANLICRDTDISKYFRESHGHRVNESRLYSGTLLNSLPHLSYIWTSLVYYLVICLSWIIASSADVDQTPSFTASGQLLNCYRHACPNTVYTRCLRFTEVFTEVIVCKSDVMIMFEKVCRLPSSACFDNRTLTHPSKDKHIPLYTAMSTKHVLKNERKFVRYIWITWPR